MEFVLQDSRAKGNKCAWADVDYEYDDAVAIAQLWNMDVVRAKSLIAEKVTHGHSQIIDQALGR
jgi:hypothetical protein